MNRFGHCKNNAMVLSINFSRQVLVPVTLEVNLTRAIANKRLVQTPPAHCNFGILARHNRFGGGVGAFLPLRAREAQYKRSVSSSIATKYSGFSCR